MQTNHCDICGVPTHFAPEQEAEFEMKEVPLEVPDEENPGQMKTVMVEQRFPVMTTRKQQNPFTGVIEDKPVQKTKDLQERAYYLQLTLGGEYCIRDVCRSCLEKEILPLARPLWDKLASLVAKD